VSTKPTTATKKLAQGQRRFVAKKRDQTWWVYDKARGSWPWNIPGAGQVKSNFRSEAECEAEALRCEQDAR
jgi:hypothetical protein